MSESYLLELSDGEYCLAGRGVALENWILQTDLCRNMTNKHYPTSFRMLEVTRSDKLNYHQVTDGYRTYFHDRLQDIKLKINVTTDIIDKQHKYILGLGQVVLAYWMNDRNMQAPACDRVAR